MDLNTCSAITIISFNNYKELFKPFYIWQEKVNAVYFKSVWPSTKKNDGVLEWHCIIT